MSRASIESSTPSSRDSTWNGKPAPSTYLHKQLDVTRRYKSLQLAIRADTLCSQRIHEFPGRLTVGQRPLEPLIVVRIHAGEPGSGRAVAESLQQVQQHLTGPR